MKTITHALCLFVLLLVLTACQDQQPPAANSGLGLTAPVTKLSEGEFQFTEGPTWDGGEYVYFTDLQAAEIHRYNIANGHFEKVRDNTLDINGLMFSPQKELWGCVQKTGSLVRMDKTGKELWIVAGEYQGKGFNQPNDLALDADGGVYFTDPSWNPSEKRNQPVKGVYYVNASGAVSLLINDMDKPNGVLVANGGRDLFVVDMGNDEFRRYPITAPGVLGDKQVFAQFQTEGTQLAQPDGLAADMQGNVYVATNTGVQVFAADGNYMGKIKVPERPSNVAFYGAERNRLFITAPNNVYSITLNTRGEVYPLATD